MTEKINPDPLTIQWLKKGWGTYLPSQAT